jgi:hypothetical protein
VSNQVTHCGGCSQCVDRRFAAYGSGAEDLDSAGIYRQEIVSDGTSDHISRQTLVDYIRQGLRYSSITLDQFEDEWLSELTDIVPHLPDQPEGEAVERIYDLHKRHGDYVRGAISEMRKQEDLSSAPPEGSVFSIVNKRDYASPNLREKLVRLEELKPGNEDAYDYEVVISEILAALFHPDLDDPDDQVWNEAGTDRVDITFRNSASSGFWSSIREYYGAFHIPVEVKNKNDLEPADIAQIYSRLSENKGRFGLLVCREVQQKDLRHAIDKMRKGKAVVLLSDHDLVEMARVRASGQNPADYISQKHRHLKQAA